MIILSDVELYLYPNVLLILGGHTAIDLGDAFPNDEKPFPDEIGINAGFNHLFIYSDLAEYTSLGVVLDESCRENKNHIHKEFGNLHDIPISKSFFV